MCFLMTSHLSWYMITVMLEFYIEIKTAFPRSITSAHPEIIVGGKGFESLGYFHSF